MIHENTKHAKELADGYRADLEKRVIHFFESCRGKKPGVIRAKFTEENGAWKMYCQSIGRIKNWPVKLNGDEFEQSTLHAYEKVYFAQGSRAGRKSILRTISIIEDKKIWPFIKRYIRLWLIKFFSGK